MNILYAGSQSVKIIPNRSLQDILGNVSTDHLCIEDLYGFILGEMNATLQVLEMGPIMHL